MRHGMAGRKFNRDTAQRKALLASLAIALLKHEQIRTTLPKAKDLRPYVEKLISKARAGGLANRRLAFAALRDERVVKKLFDVLGPRYVTRAGGYTRIIKDGLRYGDAAPMAIIELLDRDPAAKGTDSGPTAEQQDADESEEALG